MGPGAVAVDLTAVIVAVTRETPRILTVPAGPAPAAETRDALPAGPLEPHVDHTLEQALRRWVRDASGLALGYVEQLYTFGDRFRDPAEHGGAARRISVAYLALVREQRPAADVRARWRDWYAHLPWEDWREGRPDVLDRAVVPVLERWVDEARSREARRARRDRADIAFGLGGAAWDMERVLERYELLYEVAAVAEAAADAVAASAGAGRPGEVRAMPARAGAPMAMDHRRVLATALARLRGKIKYRPLVFELLPPLFTMTRLQRVVESLAGVRLHQANFRRLVEKGGLVEGTGRLDTATGGRPAELFRFRPEALREHTSTGVGLPGLPG